MLNKKESSYYRAYRRRGVLRLKSIVKKIPLTEKEKEEYDIITRFLESYNRKYPTAG